MSLLFDQNLSRRLVALLAAEYPGSEHVEGAGLLGADDLTVWQYAAGRRLMVVSKDSDFRHLALLHGPPPKVIWLVITRNGKAVAVLLVPYDDDDLERLMLGRSPRFQALLNRSRQSIKEGKGLSEGDFWEAVRKRAQERKVAAAGGRRTRR